MRTLFFSAIIIALQLVSSSTLAAELDILFLGDRGHHRPANRFEQLKPVLAARGIELSYSEDVATALQLAALDKFDGLLLYANIDKIEEHQATALIDYVARGKGFIPLHCASYCFRNNDAIVALMGAQFQKHGTGVFHTIISDEGKSHPLMQGFKSFASWDETYVHTKHNERDRTVLEYRVDDQGREPWTWVRTHGKGRVFYTAWGHDERTWGHDGFQNLVERGIRWACGANELDVAPYADRPEMTPKRTDVKPFEYVEANLPFYSPTGKRTGNDKPVSRMQKPLSPEESLNHFVTPVGFHVELFAAEPDIGKPLAMAWDERGRLWLCETVDYPNDLQPMGAGRDRIRICEDTNGDGRADRFTVFAERLSIPSAITFWRGGVVVQDGIQTVYLKDTSGDDRADLREVLITGWGMGDTHGGVSNFQFGLDNWIWAMQGYNNSTPEFNGQKGQTFRQGFFRFKLSQTDPPKVTELEFIRSTNNNTWGLGISEEGLIFGSTANGNPSEFMPIPNRYYERVRGWSAEVLRGIAESNQFEPVTDDVRQVDHHGGFTAAAGHALYTARQWPQEYWNRTAFVTEPTGHLVATFQLTPNGAGFRSRNAFNILASDDEWSAPIMAEVGPDSQLWVIDWYNIIVQHNPTPVGFKTGKGNAYEIDLRDKTHGRIYRVVYDKSSPSNSPKTLHNAQPAELVAALKSDNMLWRKHAQRLLVERGENVAPDLVGTLSNRSVDNSGSDVGMVQALHTLNGLGWLKSDNSTAMLTLTEAMKHPSAGVRRTALDVMPRDERMLAELVKSKTFDDRDPQVKLAAMLALSDMPPSADAAQIVHRIASTPKATDDRWLADALTAAAASHDRHFLAVTLDQSARQVPPSMLSIVAEHLGRGAPTDIDDLIAKIAQHASDSTTIDPILAGLAKGWPKGQGVKLSPGTEASLVPLLKQLSPNAKGSLLALATAWDVKSLEAQIGTIAADFLKHAQDERVDDDSRLASAKQFAQLRRTDVAAANELLKLINARTSPELARGIIEAIGSNESPATGPALVERFGVLTPSLRSTALRVLISRTEWINALLDALEKGTVPSADLALDQKQALAAHPTRAIAARAKAILARGGGLPNPDRQKVLADLLPLAHQTGDAKAGKEVFKKQCSKCHMHSGEGNKVGPDLTGMAVHPKHELLVHLIDPSRNVEGNFRVYAVQLTDGRTLSGLMASESKTSIEIIDAEAKRHAIQRADIDELVASTKSIMPEGFEKQVTPSDITNLLEFLTQRGKFLPIPLDKAATIVSTQGMFFKKESNVERLIFDDWKPKVFEGIPFVLVDPQGDRTPNVVMLYGPNGSQAPQMPRAVTLPCNAPAKSIHMLSGVGGWSFPASAKGTVSMIVRLRYADSQQEDHPLINGEHFADYIRRVDVAGSKFAFALRGQQIRYLAVHPKRAEKIETIELVKGPDSTAPVVMAVTVEGP
jgi:putative membrane-bound dehydrogenase-like protein